MTGLGDAMQRVAEDAGRIGLSLICGLVAIVWGLLIACLVLVLRLTKPLVLYLLILAMIGGIGVAITFGLQHKWTDALEAFGLGAGAWLVTTAYAAFARRLDPTFFDRSPLPPWWWYV